MLRPLWISYKVLHITYKLQEIITQLVGPIFSKWGKLWRKFMHLRSFSFSTGYCSLMREATPSRTLQMCWRKSSVGRLSNNHCHGIGQSIDVKVCVEPVCLLKGWSKGHLTLVEAGPPTHKNVLVWLFAATFLWVCARGGGGGTSPSLHKKCILLLNLEKGAMVMRRWTSCRMPFYW